jgi:hypothetical protein
MLLALCTLPLAPTGARAVDAITDEAELEVPTIPRPPYLVPVVEPAFNNTIRRISGDSGTPIPGISGTWGADARHVYSKQSAWSIDGSLLCLQNRGGGTPSVIFLDGASYQPLYAGCSAMYDYRWNPNPMRASQMINVDKTGTELSWIDVRSCTKVRTWALPITADYGIGSGEGNVSFDGRYVVVANDEQLAVVDMDPQPPYAPYPNRRIGPVFTLPDCDFGEDVECRIGNISISPSGKYVDVKYSGRDSTRDAHRIFAVDPVTLEVRPHRMEDTSLRCGSFVARADGWIYPLKHADMGLDPFDQNEDIIVGGRSCPGSTLGRIIKVRLRDGKVTALTNPRGEASMQHVSLRNLFRQGWAYVGYYRTDGKINSDQIMAVKLDGSLTVQSIAHKHSASDGCYRCESHPVPSPDGKRVLFASNWMQDCSGDCGPANEIKAYVVDVPITRPTRPTPPTAGQPGDSTETEAPEPVGEDEEYAEGWHGPPKPEDVVGGREPSFTGGEDPGDQGDAGFDGIGLAFESVFPNPAVSGADVVYTSRGGKSVELELVDASGRTVRRQALGVPAAGRQQVRLDRGQGLAPGIYWLRLSSSGERAKTTRLVFVG